MAVSGGSGLSLFLSPALPGLSHLRFVHSGNVHRGARFRRLSASLTPACNWKRLFPPYPRFRPEQSLEFRNLAHESCVTPSETEAGVYLPRVGGRVCSGSHP